MIARRILEGPNLRRCLEDLFNLLASILVWTVGIVISAVVLFSGLTPSSMLAGLGIGSVAIGFAFKGIFENFWPVLVFYFAARCGSVIIRTGKDLRRVTVICGVA